VLDGPCSAAALATLATEDLRLALERQGPPGLGAAIAAPGSILRDCAAALASAESREVIEAYRAVGSYPSFVRVGMRGPVLAAFRRALAGERQDMAELAPALDAIDAEEVAAALRPEERIDYLSNRAVLVPPPKHVGRAAPAAPAGRRFGIFAR
jgi:hypothetical protein